MNIENSTGALVEVILRILIRGARLRWAVRANDEPMATEGGDPSDTHKRWFGRDSGMLGWWRGSSLRRLVLAGMLRGMRAGSPPRVRPKSNGWTLRCSCRTDCLGP